MTNIKRLQISLNLDDPFQKKLYDHAVKQGNFSLYGKTLLHRDMTVTFNYSEQQPKQEEVEIDRETFEGFI